MHHSESQAVLVRAAQTSARAAEIQPVRTLMGKPGSRTLFVDSGFSGIGSLVSVLKMQRTWIHRSKHRLSEHRSKGGCDPVLRAASPNLELSVSQAARLSDPSARS